MVTMAEPHPESLRLEARAARKARKLTQQQVAAKAGVGLRTYQKFELGQQWPQQENLRSILAALDIGVVGTGPAQDGDPGEATRSSWPLHVQVFLDTVGAFLMTMTEAERLDFIGRETRAMFESRRQQPNG